MVLRFVLFRLVFDHIFDIVYIIYSGLKHIDEQQNNFHCDCHCHGWVYYVVLQKYGFKVCVIWFDFYSTHYKVFIHIPCIITQQQTTTPFNITHVISSCNLRTPILYQGLANHCKGDRNSDIICLLHPYQTIHYCNQSVLGTVPEMNILAWSITIFDIILRSALVQLFSITC